MEGASTFYQVREWHYLALDATNCCIIVLASDREKQEVGAVCQLNGRPQNARNHRAYQLNKSIARRASGSPRSPFSCTSINVGNGGNNGRCSSLKRISPCLPILFTWLAHKQVTQLLPARHGSNGPAARTRIYDGLAAADGQPCTS